jgi:hypothetical protein
VPAPPGQYSCEEWQIIGRCSVSKPLPSAASCIFRRGPSNLACKLLEAVPPLTCRYLTIVLAI